MNRFSIFCVNNIFGLHNDEIIFYINYYSVIYAQNIGTGRPGLLGTTRLAIRTKKSIQSGPFLISDASE